MVAARMRHIGNAGHHVDPGDVVAVYLAPAGVAVQFTSGIVQHVVTARDGQQLTQDDVERVVRQLTYRGPA